MAVVTDITTQHTHANTRCSNTNTITGYITLYAGILSLFNTSLARELKPDQCSDVIVVMNDNCLFRSLYQAFLLYLMYVEKAEKTQVQHCKNRVALTIYGYLSCNTHT